MTWTPEHSILLAREICGYEVQTSPRGVHYVIEDGRTRPLPDFPNDPGETLTTLAAWLKVEGVTATIDALPRRSFSVYLSWSNRFSIGYGNTIAKAVCEALWLAKTTEVPQ